MSFRRVQTQHLIPPLLALIPVVVFLIPGLPARLQEGAAQRLLPSAPYVLGILFCLLSLRLNQSGCFFTGLLLLSFNFILQQSVQGSLLQLGTDFYAGIYALVIPICLIVYYALGEGPFFGAKGVVRLWLTLGLPLLAVLLHRLEPGWIPNLLELRLLPEVGRPGNLPDLGLILLLTAVLLIIILGPRESGYYTYSLLVAILPLVWLLVLYSGSVEPSAFPLSLGLFSSFLILLYGLYRLYWQRVYIDELTGLPNRRAFNERLRFLGRDYSLAMMDIDHFKQVNDTYGHPEGDNVLRWVAKLAREELDGQVYRYGGEEFAVILPHTPLSPAWERLEALRKKLAGSAFFLRQANRARRARQERRKSRKGGRSQDVSPPNPVRPNAVRAQRGVGAEARRVRVEITISVGVAQAGRERRKPQAVLALADQALYRAKEAGRNRVLKSA